MGKGYSLRDWYVWYFTEELTEDVMENLQLAWFPDSDVIRLLPELRDFPFDPDNLIVKEATPDMALNPPYVPPTVPTLPTPPPPVDTSDPWTVPKSKNYPSNFVVHKDVVFGMHGIKPTEVWNFFANGLTLLEPLHNNYFGKDIPTMKLPAFWSDCMTVEQFHMGFCGLTPKEISLDGWKNCHDLPWNEPLRYQDLECETIPAGPAGAHVFTHYVTWGLKHLLAETDHHKDFLVWDVQHRS